tara:strand:- start:1010 stop:2281 length:1272 start_codon:yes stop_codon:yes gene_type:complete
MPHQLGKKYGFTHGHNEGDRIEIYGGNTQIWIIKDKYNTEGNGLTYKVLKAPSDKDFYNVENIEKGIIDLPGYVFQSLGIGGKKRHQRYRTSGDDSRYLWAGGKFNSAIRIVDGKRQVYDNTVGRFVPIKDLHGFQKKGQNYTVIMPGEGNSEAINEYNEAVENEGQERRNVRSRRLAAENKAQVARIQKKIDPYRSTEDLLKDYNKQVAAYNAHVRTREGIAPAITAGLGPIPDDGSILRNTYQATFNEIQARNNELPEESRITLPIPGVEYVPKKEVSHFQPFILPDGYPPLTDYDYSKVDTPGKGFYTEPGSMESIAAWNLKGLEGLDLGIDYSKMNKYPSAFGGAGPTLNSAKDQTINVENTGNTQEEVTNKIDNGGTQPISKEIPIVDIPSDAPIFPQGLRYREGSNAYNKYNLRIQK